MKHTFLWDNPPGGQVRITTEIILTGWDLGIPGPDRTAIYYTLKPVLQLCTDRILISKVVAPGRAA
jgi:hypothetical protein